MEMSAKGLSLPTFCSSMESSTTAYVLCGIAAFVLWNVVSYMVNSGRSKEGSARPPKRDERNGGGAVAMAVSTASAQLTGDAIKSGEHLGNGFAGRTESEPAHDLSESKKSPPAKRDEQNGGGAVAKAVSTASVPPAGDVNHLGNGIAGRFESESAHDQDVSIELRPSFGSQGFDASARGQTWEKAPAMEVDGVCEEVAVRRLADGWKGEGPHVVHLIECGWTEEDLDVHQCPIELYTWFNLHQSCGCSFELAVILQDKEMRRIAEHQYGPASYKPRVNMYKKVSLIFENYGAGVRYVTYSHRRRKSTEEECKRHCVSEMYSGLRKLLKINNLK